DSNSLVNIDLSHNKLTNMDFAKTATLPNMATLNVSDNQIANIDGVKGLANKFPKLTYWNGDKNQIHDFSPMIGYTTKYNDYYEDDDHYAHGRDQVVDTNITLTKPDKNNFTYDIDNILKTTLIDFTTGEIGKGAPDDNGTFDVAPANEDSNVYTFGDDYNPESNTIPLVVKDKDNLPNNISIYFAGSHGQEGGIVNYHINWKDAGPAKQGKVTAKYVDTDGKTIAADKVLTGDVDTAYQTEKQSIDGYTFKEIQGNATGKYTEADQTVTYVYTKDVVPAKKGKVT
ncbi:MucBP domain-containing protein, partial [Weissella minor]|uniref:MucBP domain-containing protein n=1 Tax=Weissella minor TaxID=1620 RepID=UPI001BAFD636